MTQVLYTHYIIFPQVCDIHDVENENEMFHFFLRHSVEKNNC